MARDNRGSSLPFAGIAMLPRRASDFDAACACGALTDVRGQILRLRTLRVLRSGQGALHPPLDDVFRLQPFVELLDLLARVAHADVAFQRGLSVGAEVGEVRDEGGPFANAGACGAAGAGGAGVAFLVRLP